MSITRPIKPDPLGTALRDPLGTALRDRDPLGTELRDPLAAAASSAKEENVYFILCKFFPGNARTTHGYYFLKQNLNLPPRFERCARSPATMASYSSKVEAACAESNFKIRFIPHF